MARLALQFLAFACFVVVVFVLVKFLRDDAVTRRLNELEKGDAFDGLAGSDNAGAAEGARSKLNLRVPQRVRSSIAESGVMLRVDEFVLGWIALTVLPAMLCFFITNNPVYSVGLAFVGGFAPPLYIGMLKKRRLSLFSTQLGDALMLMSNGLRAGFSFEQVMESVCRDMPEPISQEFNRAVREMKMGTSLEDALTAVSDRMSNLDMQLLTSAVMVQRKVGGNLAEILDNISDTIRARIKLRRNIKTLTAQGRFSGYIVGLLPVGSFILISIYNPSYLTIYFTTMLGAIILVIAAVLEVTAFLIIRKMVSLGLD